MLPFRITTLCERAESVTNTNTHTHSLCFLNTTAIHERRLEALHNFSSWVVVQIEGCLGSSWWGVVCKYRVVVKAQDHMLEGRLSKVCGSAFCPEAGREKVLILTIRFGLFGMLRPRSTSGSIRNGRSCQLWCHDNKRRPDLFKSCAHHEVLVARLCVPTNCQPGLLVSCSLTFVELSCLASQLLFKLLDKHEIGDVPSVLAHNKDL